MTQVFKVESGQEERGSEESTAETTLKSLGIYSRGVSLGCPALRTLKVKRGRAEGKDVI